MTDTNCTTCELPDENPLNQKVGDCSTATAVTENNCPDGSLPMCKPAPDCDLWELTKNPETCLIASYIDESLRIGGADINVHKLLGVHEQGSLDDLTGHGTAISGGDHPNFPAANAFDKFITEWHSRQTGTDVVTQSYIGYDFGPIKLDNDRLRYGVETFLKKEVSTLRIKQGCESANRVTKVRVERSPDGQKWYGVAVLDLPDCDALTLLHFKRSVPSRYWRVRPLAFNGSQSDHWAVQALELIDFESTAIDNIQDKVLLENRDRDYAKQSVRMKASYTPVDVQANAEKWGFVGQESYILETSFLATLAKLGRPFVIGDIIELPSEKQYTPSLRAVLKYVEVIDVAWSTNGYTPQWVPTMQRLICRPALASQETQDIYGDLTEHRDTSGLVDAGDPKKYQDWSDVSETVAAEANTRKPVDGIDYANIQKLSPEFIDAMAKNGKNVKNLDRNRNQYGIDAMPPNGLPYTQGDEFPDSPKHLAYHRLTFTASGRPIPARLYRYSAKKKNWVYLETDRRMQMRNDKSMLEEYKSHPNATSTRDIDRTLQQDL